MGKAVAKTRKYAGIEIAAALCVLGALALLGVMFYAWGKMDRFASGRQRVYVLFSAASGLKLDAPVHYNGIRVGRVAGLQSAHLDQNLVQRLAPVKKDQLDGLPFTEKERRRLRNLPEEALQGELRQALAGRAMVLAELDLTQAGNVSRYRTGDGIRVVTDMMGEARVDLVSGDGDILKEGDQTILVGVSGDIFTQLGRSVDEVESLLNSFRNVVGAQEKLSIHTAATRIDHILELSQKNAKIVKERAGPTGEKFKQTKEMTFATVETVGAAYGDLQPVAQRLKMRISLVKRQLPPKLKELGAELKAFKEGVAQGAGRIRKDIGEMKTGLGRDPEEMRDNFKALGGKLDEIVDRINNIRRLSGRIIGQSVTEIKDIQRLAEKGARNLRELDEMEGKLRKVIGKKAKGEFSYYNSLQTWRTLLQVARWPRDTLAEVEAAKGLVPDPPRFNQKPTVDQINRVEERLINLLTLLEAGRDAGSAALLPPYGGRPGAPRKSETGEELAPYPRKRGAWGADE
jgi:hypothetical protein